MMNSEPEQPADMERRRTDQPQSHQIGAKPEGGSKLLPVVGHGFDLHRLEPLAEKTGSAAGGRPLIIGGVRIEHDLGPVGHSDGDAVLHAVTDAILGALGEPDIGELFPDTSPKWKGADSRIFLAEALARMRRHGLGISNIDVTVILQRPRIAPHKDAIRSKLASMLAVSTNQVNLKGKTHENLDALGEGRGIAVHAVCLLWPEVW